MKILVDENIPFADKLFSRLGEVTTISGRDINNKTLVDGKFEILVIRSITQVNKDLLADTKIKFVGTATIGVDHVDINYFINNNIGFSNAAGSNANSVVEYILSVLFNYCNNKLKITDFKELSVGIVGCGNIGGRLNKKLKQLGIRVLLNDPPLQEKGAPYKFHSLNDLMDVDILTIHTPLTKQGKYPTYHLFNDEILKKINKKTLLINAARGSVVDNESLVLLMKKKSLTNVVLDVWENEPNINKELLKPVLFGTPHIAGYSYDGKVNGAVQIFNAAAEYFNIDAKITSAEILPEVKDNKLKLELKDSIFETISALINKVYNVEIDSRKLKKGENFDVIRKNYPIRREFHNYDVVVNKKIPEKLINIIKILGFNII